ncbi:chemotaxis protein CheD [Tropicimonas aquimaris]|uniref:Probable chemoreceptor glutamine deamidase CheD n=1 Tax=Tropicimonas aquimaris TaxID=914152 RepID=A0ABW3IUA0_9RHOB
MSTSCDTHHIGQGEMVVSSSPDAMLTAVLGSCVAACLWDPAPGIGGMNHILLPEGAESDMRRTLYGTNAMELLINSLLQGGADRSRLRGKLFGGARMMQGLGDIGAKNGRFAVEFCKREGIEVVAMSLGGTGARRVQFWPSSGKARQRVLSDAWVPETPPRRDILRSSDVELF